jgi:diguanylate cyclase (GGDEF)-like protein
LPVSYRNLAQRLTDLIEWNDADKGILTAALTLPFVALWILRLSMVQRYPHLGPYIDQDFLRPMLGFVWIQGFGHLAIIAVGLILRRRAKRHPWFVHCVNQFWYITFFFPLYAIGPYTSAFVMLVLIGPVLGFLIFPLRPVGLGLASFALLLVASTIAERLELIPYAPLLATPPLVDGRPHYTWILSVGGIPLLASALILGIFAYVTTQWRDREQLLKDLCRTDYLTVLHNRRSFMERATIEFSRAKRFRKSLAVVILDLDHFKRVNDRFGHGTGDEVLRRVAKLLADQVRRHDIVARYGGEEFSLLLAETDGEQARIMADRCREDIEEARLIVDGVPVAVTASVGIAAYPCEGVARVEQLIDLADSALYLAKKSGRNRVSLAA